MAGNAITTAKAREAKKTGRVERAIQKHAGGRPMKYKSERRLKRALNDYFVQCDQQERPYTIQGLALSLGITRETLLQYGKKEQFSVMIKEAKEKIQLQWEERLARDKGNVAGIIFWLKNNAGYRDRTESEVVNTHLHLHGVAKASYQEADKEKVHHIEVNGSPTSPK